MTTAIFRCDALVLACPLLLMLLLRGLMPLGRMVLVGAASGLGGIGKCVVCVVSLSLSLPSGFGGAYDDEIKHAQTKPNNTKPHPQG